MKYRSMGKTRLKVMGSGLNDTGLSRKHILAGVEASLRRLRTDYVALNWLLGCPGVTAPIIGARTMEQLEDNLRAADWSLSPEQMARLQQASNVRLPYPYNYLSRL